MHREDWIPSKYSRICSNHFLAEDFDTSSPFRKYVKKDAVPSVFPELPKHLQKRKNVSDTNRLNQNYMLVFLLE